MPTSSPTDLQIAGIILTILTTSIGIHKFIIQRPRIQLKVEKERDFLRDDGVKSHLNFIIVNKGFRYAEDTYIEMRLPDWNFGKQRRRIDWNVSVSVKDSDEKDNDSDEEVSDTEENEDENTQTDSEDVVRKVDSVLDIRHDIDTYFLASGEINHIFIEDTVYNEAEFPIFYGEIHLEQFETYQLEYSAGCQSYSPRKGVIEFDVGYDEIEINHNPPRFWNAWYRYLGKIYGNLRSFTVSQIDTRLGIDLSTDDVRVIHSKLERENETNSETIINPVAGVLLSNDLEEQRSVSVKGTLYLLREGEDVILGTVTFRAYSLDAGEYWETRPPQQQWGTHRFRYNKEYGGSAFEGALPVKMIVPDEAEEPEFSVEWTVDSWVPRKGNLRGLDLNKCEFDADRTVAKGVIQNTSSVDVTVFVIAKLYTEDDILLTTPSSEITVEADSDKQFSIRSDLDPEQNERITSCECVLSNAL